MFDQNSLSKRGVVENLKQFYSEKEIINFFLSNASNKAEEVRISLQSGKTELAMMKFGEMYSALNELRTAIDTVNGDLSKDKININKEQK